MAVTLLLLLVLALVLVIVLPILVIAWAWRASGPKPRAHKGPHQTMRLYTGPDPRLRDENGQALD